MTSVRILLGEIGTRWGQVLKELAEGDDQLQILGEAEGPIDILLRTKGLSADLVVLSHTPNGGEPGICSHLLLEYPNLVVVLVPSDSGPNILCRMVLHREIRDASKEALRVLLRKLGPE